QVHFVFREALDVGLQLFDVRALLADHHARTRRVDGDAALLVRALDDHAADAGLLQPFAQVAADLDVFLQQLSVFLLARVPTRVPGTVDAQAKPVRIDLLTHQAASFLVRFAGALALDLDPDFFTVFFFAFFSSARSVTTMVICANGFSTRAPRPRA